MKKIVILGAGISGLAAAWFLKKKYKDQVALTLIEKSSRVGGWIRTVQKEGFLFEAGPRGFRPNGKGQTTLALVQELGLEHALIGANRDARKRYICLDGQLRPFSLGFLMRQGLLNAVWRDLTTVPSQAADETIAAFTQRRFNNRFAENLMDPLAKGIFGGDANQLSMRSCLPMVWELEQQKGSVLRGWLARKKQKLKPAASLYSFKSGMEALIHTLAQKIDAHIQLSSPVHTLSEIEADYIISTLPSYALAALLNQEDPCTYASLSTIHMGWTEEVLTKRGYGFLIPSKEKSAILGMTWDSEIFPQQNQGKQTRICIMVAGIRTENDLYHLAILALKNYLGITILPNVYATHIAHQAIPQYTLLHHQRIALFKQKLPPHVFAIGTCFEGVGVNDCICLARKCAENIQL